MSALCHHGHDGDVRLLVLIPDHRLDGQSHAQSLRAMLAECGFVP
jgi:hypothetical protein